MTTLNFNVCTDARANLGFNNVDVRTINGVRGVPLKFFENALCVAAQFKAQKHQFRLYRRTTFEGLILVDVYFF